MEFALYNTLVDVALFLLLGLVALRLMPITYVVFIVIFLLPFILSVQTIRQALDIPEPAPQKAPQTISELLITDSLITDSLNNAPQKIEEITGDKELARQLKEAIDRGEITPDNVRQKLDATLNQAIQNAPQLIEQLPPEIRDQIPADALGMLGAMLGGHGQAAPASGGVQPSAQSPGGAIQELPQGTKPTQIEIVQGGGGNSMVSSVYRMFTTADGAWFLVRWLWLLGALCMFMLNRDAALLGLFINTMPMPWLMQVLPMLAVWGFNHPLNAWVTELTGRKEISHDNLMALATEYWYVLAALCALPALLVMLWSFMWRIQGMVAQKETPINTPHKYRLKFGEVIYDFEIKGRKLHAAGIVFPIDELYFEKNNPLMCQLKTGSILEFIPR